MRKYIWPLLLLLMAGCSTISSFQYPPVRWLRDTDDAPIKEPRVKLTHKAPKSPYEPLYSQAEDLLTFTQEVVAMPSGWMLSGKLESVDIDNYDEVADSTWFTNRIGRTSKFENIFKTPPSLNGKWTVAAVTPAKDVSEFVIRDSRKNNYVIKIDRDPEWLVSGGEMLGALILSASGYNVTENYVLEFNSSILDTKILPPGKYRALAVRVPPGVQLGSFEIQGKRRDDPNDRIAHEYRRELCGLRVFASLLNNKSFSTQNTLDIYHNGYVTHYLSNLSGSLADMRSEFLTGSTENDASTIDALFSFGFYNPYWTSADEAKTTYKGVLSSEKFNPKKWSPDRQNIAFRYMSYRDAFWAAKILKKFTNEDIRTIVVMSGYKDKNTSDRITSEITIRWAKIMSYWFQKVNPLANFSIDGGLVFDDIGMPMGTKYRYRMRAATGRRHGNWQETTDSVIPLPAEIKDTLVVQIQTLRDPKKNIWSPSVDVYVEKKDGPTILGIHRRYYH